MPWNVEMSCKWLVNFVKKKKKNSLPRRKVPSREWNCLAFIFRQFGWALNTTVALKRLNTTKWIKLNKSPNFGTNERTWLKVFHGKWARKTFALNWSTLSNIEYIRGNKYWFTSYSSTIVFFHQSGSLTLALVILCSTSLNLYKGTCVCEWVCCSTVWKYIMDVVREGRQKKLVSTSKQ